MANTIAHAGMCPTCGNPVKRDKNHKCPAALTGVDGEVMETSRMLCENGCTIKNGNTVLPMSKYLCKCNRPKPFRGSGRAANNVIVVNIDASRFNGSNNEEDCMGDPTTGRKDNDKYVCWEEIVEFTCPSGQVIKLLVSHDTCADYSLVTDKVFDMLAEPNSVKSHEYILQTAGSRKTVEARKGSATFTRPDGTEYQVGILTCPVEHQ